MSTIVNHATITELHHKIAMWHKQIKGFYRFNWNEFGNAARSLRPDTETPVLLLESYSSQLSRNQIKTTKWNERDISFLLLDFAGETDDYDKQEEVLARLEGVGLQIIALFEKYRKQPGHWLYGLFDVNSVRFEKVGPLYDNMFGWNILYNLKSNEPLVFVDNEWDFTATA